jgi:vancomycin resistance protein YoaR
MANSSATLAYPTISRPRSTLGGRFILWLLTWIMGLALFGGIALWQYQSHYEGRILPGVTVNGVPLGGLTPDEAEAVLRDRLVVGNNATLTLTTDTQSWTANSIDLGVQFDTAATVADAMTLGRDGGLTERWSNRFALWRGDEMGRVQPHYTRDITAIDTLLTQIANTVNRDPQDGSITIQGLTVSVTPEKSGQQLDYAASRERLLQALASDQRHVELVTVERLPHVVGAEAAAELARTLLDTPMVFYLDQPETVEQAGQYQSVLQRRDWMVERARLAEMIGVYSEPLPDGSYQLTVKMKPESLRAEVERIGGLVARPARDARFDYDPNTGTLTPLVISQEGLELNADAAMQAINEAVANGQNEIQLPLTIITPEVATGDAALMNITGLAVQGFSNYTGSSYEREVNLSVAAEQYHGIVIPPGDVFSFNEHLGWVVDANGYEEGYIIVGNRTEVDVGGGVCQVSTTIFRAAFNAGFEIVERHPHAYRVAYYENGDPVGWDATIFSPIVDFKFRNDTPNYYLLEVETNQAANTLTMNLYGAPTGRTVAMDSRVTATVPHGPDIYEDDPALAAGVVEQVDWSHDGATVVVSRVVTDNATGQVLYDDDFWSEYRPWQARFRVGTGAGGQ